MMDLDAVDFQIISALQEDGRRPAVKIAEQIGVSEATVRRRVDKLLEMDVIRISAVSDPFKLGFHIVVIIGVKVDQPRLLDAADVLAGFNEVQFLGLTAGRYAMVLEAWFKSNEDLRRFLAEQMPAIPGIRDVEVTHILKMVKYTYDWGKGDIAELADEILGIR